MRLPAGYRRSRGVRVGEGRTLKRQWPTSGLLHLLNVGERKEKVSTY